MNISNGEEAEQQIRDIPFVNHLESERKLDPFDVVYGRELQSPILGDRYQLPDLPTCYVPSTTLDTSLLHGGDILLETISSNVTEDLITLEFQRSDGTLVTQLIDFKNEVQVIKALVLGEEERGQNQYQVMCFVNHFYKVDFISSDAMSKLRQKNPGTVRVAEEDRGHVNYTMDLFLDVSQSKEISKHVATLCAEAAGSTYTRNDDIKQWIQRPELFMGRMTYKDTVD
ncbi:out at first protein [Lasius niger]|uniref:Out at first protein n=1 Tax=Lasius niger TaxID=67767 RepID=A0A0J7KFB4_LASNI|nr:out at first protein [Lasius niger]